MAPVAVTVPWPEVAAEEDEAPAVAAGRFRVAGLMNEGEYVSVPEYCGHPGTVVLGGARPPPQSRKSHTSPEPGTYQTRVA